MHRLENRIEKTEDPAESLPLLVHMFPDQTEEEAFAAHILENGPIPEDKKVIVIVHSFRSNI